MELTDSTRGKPEQTRPVLGIDLNETPSSSSSSSEVLSPEALHVVRTFHDIPKPPPAGAPPAVPGDTFESACSACGRPEVGGHVVVCDGCERGFHLVCAGMLGRQAVILDEWMCGECASNGVPSNRWPLGLKSWASGQKRSRVRFLDISASPPTGGEGEGSEFFTDSRKCPWDIIHHLLSLGELIGVDIFYRKHTTYDDSLGGNLPFGHPLTYSHSLYVGNGFGFQKAPGVVTHKVKLRFEDILNHTHSVARNLEKAGMHSFLGELRNNNHSATKQAPYNPSEMCLQALKEFVSERHGVLEDGWHVEFKTSTSSTEQHAIYCAPDGKTFNSIPEVACHLGLMSNSNLSEPIARSNGSTWLRRASHLDIRKKSARFPVADGVTKNHETLRSLCEDLSFDFHANMANVGARSEENSGTGTQQFNEGLPVQYEDFFVLSLGNVDTRPSYHNDKQIWPVGYRSCWHDKITGSLFICDVSDGGDSGPVFKVSRCSCSTLPIPSGSSVLFAPNARQSVCQKKEKNKSMACVDTDYEEYYSVQRLLSDISPAKENDLLSCLTGFSDESFNFQTSNILQLEDSPLREGFGNVLSENSALWDEIGEFSVIESSSSSAWRMVSKKFVDTCRHICMQRGALKMFCEHVRNGTSLTCFDCMDEKDEGKYTSLARFYGSSCSIKIPSVIKGGLELENVFEVLLKWLDQDRFGLDIEFVQEILEQLSGVDACLKYVFLRERSYYSSSVTVGNGLLLVKTKDGGQGKEKEALDNVQRGCKRARTEMGEDPVMESPYLPPGKSISSKLPVEIVGDVLQVYEFLCRFYEVLGLEDILSIDEFEEELISPWIDGFSLLQKFEGNTNASHDITSRSDGSSPHILSPGIESGPAVSTESHAFIAVQREAMKEETHSRAESIICSRGTGIALSNAHCSILKVLIGELQSRVAAIMYPTFDTGDSKAKRGGTKDMDHAVTTEGTKMNLLPVNELTWPELVRRYMLAILSMGGSVDSPEIAVHESAKMLRCLQGDGGVLCGSLTGVVGMEADAVLLAQAMKEIFGSLNRENDMLSIDDGGSDATSACESSNLSNGNIPEWAQLLEPVRKLPTNVGTRIRKCVYNALDKDPPEWAKKILEHSISKGVYKGNASGPTKKAVLSVLADVHAEEKRKKPEREKRRKNFISVSDIIMKQCRIVLRQVAVADSKKVLCNLLGRKLINCSDNNDKGILGSPAMISRPLDFRTIDLRLAVEAYGGSHEAFLEDVRELWTHVRIAYGDQPDMIQLVEALSSNFESLYETKVVSLSRKLAECSKSGCLTTGTKKELDDFFFSSSELPKAPWEEGVCKVCGIDKDDDSVLLCDTCDAEYHKYCLNPPLARVPQGNWYCPSCAVSRGNDQDAPKCTSTICPNQRKHHGEITRVFLDALRYLVFLLEEKEYWEFNVDERIFLLKFLCDELLNSALIRHHLKHCVDLSDSLREKLCSVSREWRNLKSKEENLAANVAETDKYSSYSNLEEKSAGNGLITKILDAEDPNKDFQAAVVGTQSSGNSSSLMTNLAKDKSVRQKELLASDNPEQEMNDLSRGHIFQDSMKIYVGKDAFNLPSPEDWQGVCPLLDRSSQIHDHVPSAAWSESQANILELNSVRNELSLKDDSIRSIKRQLMKLSVRREFLGSDSAGRSYWVLAKPGRHPWVVANSRELMLQKMTSGPGAASPSMKELSDANTSSFPWVTYQTDAEIEELVECLRDDDPKEIELKESILCWLKLRFQFLEQTENQDQGEPQMVSSVLKNRENSLYSESLITKATSLLESKYGPCSEPETIDLKKQGSRAKVTAVDKMFRCDCLEPVWPIRHHCLSCHRTFLTEVELKGHTYAMCKLALLTSKKSMGNMTSKGKQMMKSENLHEECTGEMDFLQASKSDYHVLKSKLTKFQNDESECPYDFDDICLKFVTQNSTKELVHEIGLLGSNGIPVFVPSVSPHLSDPTLMLVPKKRNVGVSFEVPETDEQLVLNQGIRVTTDAGYDSISSRSPGRCVENELAGAFKSDKPVSCSDASVLDVDNCCVIPKSALRPVAGKASCTFKLLKINLLDMDAALPETALRPSKAQLERRWAWRAFVKSAETIYEMVQAVIVFEDMIKTEYLGNMWCYWSSLSAASKISTLSSLALRIYTLDALIDYEKSCSNLEQLEFSTKPDQKQEAVSDAAETFKLGRKLKRKRGD